MSAVSRRLEFVEVISNRLCSLNRHKTPGEAFAILIRFFSSSSQAVGLRASVQPDGWGSCHSAALPGGAVNGHVYFPLPEEGSACPMETADFRSLATGLWPPKLAVGRQTAFQYPSHNETMGLVGDGPSQESVRPSSSCS